MKQKPSKSQWDFGELFPVAETRKVLTVAELTTMVKRLLERAGGQIWVGGEVTNYRAQSSGHIYFTLKDADSQVNCVLFRNDARVGRNLLADGRHVVIQGDLTIYEPRGQYQLRVTAVELQGVGALQAAFEKLKQKLDGEGLFAMERKRPLPRYPRRIGIVTSPTGAAIRDVLHAVGRRDAGLEMVLAPCRVQGQGAAEEIAAAIRLLNEFAAGRGRNGTERTLDLILVTRGGGSLEDLWAFNEEVVAQAIFDSALPVISAIGHEIDFTISDFVADFRAATPTAAAELITEGVFATGEFLGAAESRMRQFLWQRLNDKQYEAEQLRARLARLHPRRRVDEWLQRLDDLRWSLSRCVRQATRERRVTWRNVSVRLLRLRPGLVLNQRRERLAGESRRLQDQMRRQLQKQQNLFAMLATQLRLLGPEQVLARGYSITMKDESGQVIRSATEIRPGQRLRTRLKSGEIRSTMT